MCARACVVCAFICVYMCACVLISMFDGVHVVNSVTHPALQHMRTRLKQTCSLQQAKRQCAWVRVYARGKLVEETEKERLAETERETARERPRWRKREIQRRRQQKEKWRRGRGQNILR